MNTASIKSCVAALAAAAALSASADLLYWTVSDAIYDANSGKPGTEAEFAYATVSANGEHLNIYSPSAGDTGYWKLYAKEGDARSTDWAYSGFAGGEGTFSNGTVFKVELWNDDDEQVGWQTYNIASIMGSIWTNGESGSGEKGLTVRQVIPEPTSGLLLLVGGALLALRRRRGGVC